MKKAVSVLLATALLFSISSAVFASSSYHINYLNALERHRIWREQSDREENINNSIESDNMILDHGFADGGSKPTEVTAWDEDNIIPYSGSAESRRKLFSEGMFTDATEVRFSIVNRRESGSITVTLWEEKSVFSPTVSRKLDAGDTIAFTVSGLDSSKKYYIASSGATDLVGHARKIE